MAVSTILSCAGSLRRIGLCKHRGIRNRLICPQMVNPIVKELKIQSELDKNACKTRTKAREKEMKIIYKIKFHGQWNYVIKPKTRLK